MSIFARTQRAEKVKVVTLGATCHACGKEETVQEATESDAMTTLRRLGWRYVRGKLACSEACAK